MSGLEATGFWSYSHKDNEQDGGRIVDLARDLQDAYGVLTGEELKLFLDRDVIEWGDDWREVIEEGLARGTFFIPVVTTRFFQREECRRELLTFSRRADASNVGNLVLPILYARVPGLRSDSDDEAIAAVARKQYEDWTELRLQGRRSSEYRKGVHALAMRLVTIGEEVSEVPVIPEPPEEESGGLARRKPRPSPPDADGGTSGVEEWDTAPGRLDVLAASEKALPRVGELLEEVGSVVERIGGLFAEETARTQELPAEEQTFATQLEVARRLAKALEAPSGELLELASAYASELLVLDSGVVELIDLAKGAQTPDDIAIAEGLFDAIRGLAAASHSSMAGIRAFSDVIRETAGISRDLRPPLRKIQDALLRFEDGNGVMQAWVQRINVANHALGEGRVREWLRAEGWVLQESETKADVVADRGGERLYAEVKAWQRSVDRRAVESWVRDLAGIQEADPNARVGVFLTAGNFTKVGRKAALTTPIEFWVPTEGGFERLT